MKITNVGGRLDAWVPNRMRGSELGEERVELAGRDPGVPRVERKFERRNEFLHVPAGLR